MTENQNEPLPEELQLAQKQIDEWHKDQHLKKLIGKYYTKHTGYGYATHLRRIFFDKNKEIRVEEYHRPNNHSEFHFTTWTIKEATDLVNQYDYDEVDGKVYYDILNNYLSTPALKSLMVEKQGNAIKALRTEVNTHVKKYEELVKEKSDMAWKLGNIKSAVSYFRTEHGEKDIDKFVEILKKTLEIVDD